MLATRPRHSVLTFAALMTGDQRATSLLTRARSGCWPRFGLSGMSQPRSSRRLRTLSSSSALSSASVSLSMIGFGVPFGANRAFQADASNSGMPASFDVGTFSMVTLRPAVSDGLGLGRSGLNLLNDVGDGIAHVIDLAA